MTLSEVSGNPANAIRDQYQDLMALQDIDDLKVRAIAIVNQGGISQRNAARFKNVVARETRLEKLRFYLTNFILAADGLAVV